MHNSILIAILMMLVPGMASAQFYTITKKADVRLIQTSHNGKDIENKEDTSKASMYKEAKETLEVPPTVGTEKHLNAQKVYDSTSQKSERIEPDRSLPKLTVPNLYAEIKRNGILYPKVVLAQAILETGWFTSPLCRDRHNLFGLTNPHTKKYYEFDHWTESVRAYYTKVQYRYKREDGNYLLWLRNIGYAEAPDYIPAVIRVLKML